MVIRELSLVLVILATNDFKGSAIDTWSLVIMTRASSPSLTRRKTMIFKSMVCLHTSAHT